MSKRPRSLKINALKALAAGFSKTDVANAAGVCKATVYTWSRDGSLKVKQLKVSESVYLKPVSSTVAIHIGSKVRLEVAPELLSSNFLMQLSQL